MHLGSGSLNSLATLRNYFERLHDGLKYSVQVEVWGRGRPKEILY